MPGRWNVLSLIWLLTCWKMTRPTDVVAKREVISQKKLLEADKITSNSRVKGEL